MSNFKQPGLAVTFETRVPGKWILCGEHAVLHGVPAIALPHPDYSLSLSFRPGGTGLRIAPEISAEPIRAILAARAAAAIRSNLEPSGELQIASTIPIGAGLGSSAALCVALARWFAPGASLVEITHAATELEHRFHGRSSGMDVAVAAAGLAVRYTRGEAPEALELPPLPRFTFHDTGLRAATRDCVAQVENFHLASPTEARAVDEQMSRAGTTALEGLQRSDLARVAQGMREAQACFAAWSLVPPAAQDLQTELMAQGALATKLTGAGGGGFVVALWAS